MFNISKWSMTLSRIILKAEVSQSLRISKRFKRFVRNPIKVLTDDGHDYYEKFGTTERVNSLKNEVSREDLAKHYRIQDYYDEGFVDEDIDDGNPFRRKQNNYNDKRNYKSRKTLDFKDENSGDLNNLKSNDFKRKNHVKSVKSDDEFIDKKSNFNTEKFRKKYQTHNGPRIPGIPVYEKLGEDKREFIDIMSKVKSRKFREKKRLMILEGKRLIADAIDAGVKLNTIYFSIEENLIGIPNLNELINSGVGLKKVFYKDMKLFSDHVTSPGVIGVFERPTNDTIVNSSLYQNSSILPITLIGDNIRDPGNLGSLIRCAAGVGVQRIVLTKGCVDPWEAKVLRSGVGTHFRIPIICDLEWPHIVNYVNQSHDLFIADTNNFNSNANLKNLISQSFKEHENQITEEIDEYTQKVTLRDNSYAEENDLSPYRTAPIITDTYSNFNFFNDEPIKQCVLIIGGETHGLSDQSYKLAYDYCGKKINIPLSYGVDSLNSAIAAAVILYEMRRQFQSNRLQNSVKIKQSPEQ